MQGAVFPLLERRPRAIHVGHANAKHAHNGQPKESSHNSKTIREFCHGAILTASFAEHSIAVIAVKRLLGVGMVLEFQHPPTSPSISPTTPKKIGGCGRKRETGRKEKRKRETGRKKRRKEEQRGVPSRWNSNARRRQEDDADLGRGVPPCNAVLPSTSAAFSSASDHTQ
ncbi:hypothetical protein LXL04_024953 [Taraxacum kok-saghyz]